MSSMLLLVTLVMCFGGPMLLMLLFGMQVKPSRAVAFGYILALAIFAMWIHVVPMPSTSADVLGLGALILGFYWFVSWCAWTLVYIFSAKLMLR